MPNCFTISFRKLNRLYILLTRDISLFYNTLSISKDLDLFSIKKIEVFFQGFINLKYSNNNY